MSKRLKDDDCVATMRPIDTGIAKRVSVEDVVVLRDIPREHSTHPREDVARLPWSLREQKGEYLYVTKAWRNFFNRKRYLSIYIFPVKREGGLGRREQIHYRVNGTPRPFK